MNISFKQAGKSSAHVIKEMLYHALYFPENEPIPPKNIIEIPELRKYYENWGKRTDAGWIAYNENNPVGAVWIRLLAGVNRGYGYVDEKTPELSIAVLPEYRNKGIGTNLLERIIKDIRIKNQGVCLNVSKGNPALSLYKRFGFREIHESDNSITMIRESAPGNSLPSTQSWDN